MAWIGVPTPARPKAGDAVIATRLKPKARLRTTRAIRLFECQPENRAYQS